MSDVLIISVGVFCLFTGGYLIGRSRGRAQGYLQSVADYAATGKFREPPDERPRRISRRSAPHPAPESERLRAYIVELLEPKRHNQCLQPDLAARTFLAFTDAEKAAFFNRLALRVKVEKGALMRVRDWQPMVEQMHFDSLFLLARALYPMMYQELGRLWDVRSRVLPQQDDPEGQ